MGSGSKAKGASQKRGGWACAGGLSCLKGRVQGLPGPGPRRVAGVRLAGRGREGMSKTPAAQGEEVLLPSASLQQGPS